MDINQELKNTENSLRDFIAYILEEKYDKDWIENSGVSRERIENWTRRMNSDKISNELRLIYYSDFYDLQTIIKKHWDIFRDIFKDLKVTEVYLTVLEGFRNTDSHRRELLPYQEYLIKGLCGEIRNNIVKYRSKKETGEDCFARFEFAQDNLGNSWKVGSGSIDTNLVLRPGDRLEFTVTASDAQGGKLKYKVGNRTEWQDENKFSFEIGEEDIAQESIWGIMVRSDRPYYSNKLLQADDFIVFKYTILPSKNS